MDETVKLLRDVARSARVGEAAAAKLIDRAPDAKLRSELSAVRERYRSAAREAEQALSEVGGVPEPFVSTARADARQGVQTTAPTDFSSAGIAEVMIRHAALGVIEMTHSRSACADADPAASGIASRYIVLQNDIIDRQKTFL